ncbi:MAG: SDR family oxidoreductase [Ignavibacteriales bacterium]|nr:SDR family oxidoreductase [Ignavibacteriales bacterium]
MSLKGKTALVTGGTGALGSVVVERFLREGMNVAASTQKTETETIRKEGTPLLIRADVADEFEVRNLFDKVLRRYKTLDIVVNTVGGFLPTRPITEVSVADWEKMMSMNLKTAFLCTREALRRMKGRSYGRIVNISAMVGLQPSPGKAPYAISKAGVSLLTDITAREIKGSGITVNAIAPSIIATAANKSSMPDEDFNKWVTPESIAETICYLCSESGGSINGTTIRAYGGL